MQIRDYFDLAKPVTFKKAEVTKEEKPRATSAAPAEAKGLGWGWQVLIYLILLVAIVASRFLDLYRAGALADFRLDGPYLLAVVIFSLLAFPVVYDKASLNKGAPVMVQVALIFTSGMGWEKIVATMAGK